GLERLEQGTDALQIAGAAYKHRRRRIEAMLAHQAVEPALESAVDVVGLEGTRQFIAGFEAPFLGSRLIFLLRRGSDKDASSCDEDARTHGCCPFRRSLGLTLHFRMTRR